MELNYLGRIKSLLEFYNSIKNSESTKIVIARGYTPWTGGRPPFDPAVCNLNQVQPETRVALDKARTLSSASVSVSADYYLISETLISDLTPVKTVTYNNSNFHAYSVLLNNALKFAGKLLLYMEFKFTNNAADAVHFRQLGFLSSSYKRPSAGSAPDDDNTTDVFFYENLSVQTININEQNTLTLKLVVAF